VKIGVPLETIVGRVARKLSHRFRKAGLTRDDLFNAGLLDCLRAAGRHDPVRGELDKFLRCVAFRAMMKRLRDAGEFRPVELCRLAREPAAWGKSDADDRDELATLRTRVRGPVRRELFDRMLAGGLCPTDAGREIGLSKAMSWWHWRTAVREMTQCLKREIVWRPTSDRGSATG